MGWDGIVCELGACLCNIPNITNKNSYEQQIDQGNKIGLKLKNKKNERNSSIFHANLPLYFHTLSFKFHLSLSLKSQLLPLPSYRHRHASLKSLALDLLLSKLALDLLPYRAKAASNLLWSYEIWWWMYWYCDTCSDGGNWEEEWWWCRLVIISFLSLLLSISDLGLWSFWCYLILLVLDCGCDLWIEFFRFGFYFCYVVLYFLIGVCKKPRNRKNRPKSTELLPKFWFGFDFIF